MPLKMKELPKTERPYEKMKMFGESKLSNAELLAIIIKSGTKEENSIMIANRMLLLVDNLSGLVDISIEKLKEIKGIGEVKAIQIKAACELARRIGAQTKEITKRIKTPADIANLVMNEMQFEKQEIIKTVLLNTKNEVIKIVEVVKGDVNVANVTVKQILSEPIKMQVNKFILIHNHPSGDPTPSNADYELTKTIIKASEIMGITLLDHIVIGNNSYESIFSGRELKNEFIGF